jgi:hypothetical protein
VACKPFNGLLGFESTGLLKVHFNRSGLLMAWLVQVLLPDGAPRRADALNKSEGGGKQAVDLWLTP